MSKYESVGGNGGFVAAFQTIAVLSYGLCCVAVNHLLSASAPRQRGDQHQHSPRLQFLSCWRFYLGRSPDAAACLSTSSSCWLRLFIFGSDYTYSYNSFQLWSTGISSDTRALRRSLTPGYQGPTIWTTMVVLTQSRCSVKQVDCKNHPVICVWFVRQDICKSLWCHRTGHRCETKFMPAAEGTTCGPDMVRKSLHIYEYSFIVALDSVHWCECFSCSSVGVSQWLNLLLAEFVKTFGSFN